MCRGVDILHSGSGNPGASNTARTVGARWGVVVFVLDGLKGAIPAAIGLLLDHRGVVRTHSSPQPPSVTCSR